MGGLLIAATASVNLYAEDTSPQQLPQATADDVDETSSMIVGLHPRGTWRIYKEATADKPRGLLEVYINQGMHSLRDYDEWETEEGNSSVYRRYATKLDRRAKFKTVRLAALERAMDLSKLTYDQMDFIAERKAQGSAFKYTTFKGWLFGKGWKNFDESTKTVVWPERLVPVIGG
ncbi:MAG: hypothetical protein IKD12_05855 [Paludibacteraceae bacterium]|nr:hypothetical protein [Paludibacteraceae bacterium]